MEERTIYMVRTRIAVDPPSFEPNFPPKSVQPTDILQVRAHFEYCESSYFGGKIYAIQMEVQILVFLERMLQFCHIQEDLQT